MEHENLQEFLKWAADLGISDSPPPEAATAAASDSNNYSCLGHTLVVAHFPDTGGRGLCAVRDMKRGELVLRIPKSALFTTRSLLEEDEFLSVAVNSHSPLSPTQMLTVCLLYEIGKAKNSHWYPYFVHFPRSYDLLATFNEFEKKALQVDDAIWATEKAVLTAKLDWKEACSLLRQLGLKPQLLTLRAWIWASATVSSRTLHVPWDEAGCLCPVGDLFNYAAPGAGSDDVDHADDLMPASMQTNSLFNEDHTGKFNEEKLVALLQRLTDGGINEDLNAYCLYARKNYKKGEQVLLCYGTYTNLELLEHYGFLLDQNLNDKIFIPLEPDMYSINSWPKESMHIQQDGLPSFSLWSALRLWATPSNQRKSIVHLVYSGSVISVQNEISVMKWLSKKCQELLDDLPTTIADDILLLSTINQIQNFHELLELSEMPCSVESEISSFVKAATLQNGETKSDSTASSRKWKRSVDKWRLAVQWRLRYKKTLTECIRYCTEVSNAVSDVSMKAVQ